MGQLLHKSQSFPLPPPEETAPVIVELTRKQIEVFDAVAAFLKTGFIDRGFKPFMEWIYDTAPGIMLTLKLRRKMLCAFWTGWSVQCGFPTQLLRTEARRAGKS